jgi:hypothetical protein
MPLGVDGQTGKKYSCLNGHFNLQYWYEMYTQASSRILKKGEVPLPPVDNVEHACITTTVFHILS